MTNYCHLSYEDRKNIEDGLNDNKSINRTITEKINGLKWRSISILNGILCCGVRN